MCQGFDTSHGNFSMVGQQNNRLTSGTTVTVFCDEGYAPEGGHSTLQCSEDGLWEPVTPKCAGMYTYTHKWVDICTYICMHACEAL